MNPLIVIGAFVVILAALLYYLQGRQTEQETLPRASTETPKRKIVKASDYQAQYEKESEEEKKEPEQEKKETEPVSEEPTDEDISMLDGVGPKYQELLRAAGYNTIKSIADTTPVELHEKLLKTNEEQEITKRPPTMSYVEDWVASAKNR
jgi:predicted flap endonuclease-1-like 5' DNA nuclease